MMAYRAAYLASLSLDEYYERHVKPVNKWRKAGLGPYPTRAQLRRHYHRTHFFGPAYPKQRQRFLNEQARMARYEAELLESNLQGERRKRNSKEIEMENARIEADRLAKLAKLEARRIKFAKHDEDRIAKLLQRQRSIGSDGNNNLIQLPENIPRTEQGIPLSITVTMTTQKRTRHLEIRNLQKLHDTTSKIMELNLDQNDMGDLKKNPKKIQIQDNTNDMVPEPLVLKIGDEILYDEAYKNDTLWMQQIDINYTYQDKNTFNQI